MSDDPAERYMALVEALLQIHPSGLSPVGAGILAAAGLGVATDSRSFAKVLGVAHALVLREIEALSRETMVAVTRRDGRTQRTVYTLADRGERLLEAAGFKPC